MTDRIEAAVRELVAALREEAGPVAEVPDKLLSVAEAASALGIGRSTVYGEISAGRLRTLRVGRRRLISAAAVAEYVGGRSA